MVRVYIAIGSNVGDSKHFIARSVEELRKHLSEVRCAPLYTSRAVGYTNQPDFYNTALCGETKLKPAELLEVTQSIEHKIGRVHRFHWGPREIDLDIILYGDLIIDDPELIIPHPRFTERDFVLRPLLDLDQNLIDPRTKKKLKNILVSLPRSELSLFDV